MDKITFYHNPMSRSAIAHWMLEEAEAEYEVKLLSFDKAEHKTPEFLEINPMGKLPTIVHGTTVITEAAAICAYLADAFPKNQLAPPVDSPMRGTYYRWLFFAAGCVEPAVVDKAFKRPPVEKKGSVGYGTYEDTITTLEKAIGDSEYLVGNAFSAADVYVGAQLSWGMMMNSIEKRDNFVSYVKRLEQRPAFIRYAESSKSMMASLNG